MKQSTRQQRVLPIAAAFGLLALAVGPLSAGAAGVTAKAGLDQAKQAARKWQGDAVLTRIGTPGAGPEGTANLWQYDFHSPKTKKCTRVMFTAHDGRSKTRQFHGCGATNPIAGEFVDSPQVVAEAKKNGFKPSEMNTMTLGWTRDNNVKTGVYWSVSSDQDFVAGRAVTRGWCIDPKTGKFVTRLAGEWGGRR